MNKRILIIEDDKALGNGIKLALKSDELMIDHVYTIGEAKFNCLQVRYDLLILDINLPDGSGLDFLTYYQERYDQKVIILTANDLETDVVTGLEMGADDYITKPFSLMILRARVMNQLKETKASHIYKQDEFCFDFEAMHYTKGSQVVELSKTEQKLLKIFIDNRGKKLERNTLIDRIWTDDIEYVDENALSVTVKRLRDKLEDKPSKPIYIKTIYGIGYMWVI